jgi:hypothetical protein
MKDLLEGDFKNIERLLFFNKRLDSNSERLDDLMKDLLEGNFKNLERLLFLRRKT